MTSRWKFLKKLPKNPLHKEEGCDRLFLLKIMSHLFPIKCMFLGLIGQIVRHHGFDGNILLKCVSEEVPVSRLTAHTNFSDDLLINGAIRNSDWWQLIIDDTATSNNIDEILSGSYGLDGSVSDQLETYYTTYIGSNDNKKDAMCVYNENIFNQTMRTDVDNSVPSISFSLNDIKLSVRYQQGSTVKRDVRCYGKYILSDIRRVGAAIQLKYHWVPLIIKLYLVLDNVGGHKDDD